MPTTRRMTPMFRLIRTVLDGETVTAYNGCELKLEGEYRNGRFVMTGPSGRHSLDARSTDAARLWAHWQGFLQNNNNGVAVPDDTTPTTHDCRAILEDRYNDGHLSTQYKARVIVEGAENGFSGYGICFIPRAPRGGRRRAARWSRDRGARCSGSAP